MTKTHIPSASRCTHRNARNHRCRMLLAPSHASLCAEHAAEETRVRNAEIVAVELTSFSGEFKTTTDLNHALGKLFDLLAQDRIDRRKAHTLAYISHLIFGTLRGVKNELQNARGDGAWLHAILHSLQSVPSVQKKPSVALPSPAPRPAAPLPSVPSPVTRLP